MKKFLCALVCLLALTACGSAENAPAAQTVTETSAETETTSETEAETVHNSDTDNAPPTEEKREIKGDIIRVTAVDGDVITGEKMWGGRGFGGGRPDGNAPSPEGEMPEKGDRPEGEPPAIPEDGSMPEKEEKNFDGERPQGETVTFTITDSTVMDMESLSEGDMISVELNEDGTAASVKAADMPARREDNAESEQ
ncbi:MAG: hypothetical protein PUI48_08770 [Oscillospiraceae bacterium]|nr:hypothetical protein [Oscillospiraceae bacterium]MDY6207315.1 hypothetical protein [Oscillospiraceae bacterium]